MIGIVCALPSSAAETNKGIIRTIKGIAAYSIDGEVWRPVKEGSELRPGFTLKSAGGSVIDLFLGINGLNVRITPNTVVALDTLAYAAASNSVVITTRLDLKAGKILVTLPPLDPVSKFEVNTPNGTEKLNGGLEYTIEIPEDEDKIASGISPLDKKQTLAFCLEAARQGDAESQFHLGEIYETGRGVNSDYNKSTKWFTEAANQGYSPAQISLGMVYQFGEGVKRDGVEAYKWLQIAANAGDTNAIVPMQDLSIALDEKQIAEAKKRASAFTPKKPKSAGG